MGREWNARSEAERKALEAAFVARHAAELLLDDDAGHDHDHVHDHDRATGNATFAVRRPLPFASLYTALQRPGPLPPEVAAALRDDSRLRADLVLLLERRARRHVPRAAAAAGRSALRRREAQGFTIRVVESRARSDQVYLLIELPESVLRSVADSARRRTDDAPEAGLVPAPDAVDSATAPSPKRDGAPVGGASGSSGPGTRTVTPAQLVVKTAAEEFVKRELPPPEARTIRLVMAADDPLVHAVGDPASEIFLL